MAEFYKQAATILERVLQHQASIKSLTLAPNVKDKTRMYAIIHQVLKYRDILDELLQRTDLLKTEKKVRSFINSSHLHVSQLNRFMAMILVYDHLFGKGIQSGGQLKQLIAKHKTRLHAELTKLKIKRGVKSNGDLVSDVIQSSLDVASTVPRYIRVNLLKCKSVDNVITELQSRGFCPEKDQHLSDLLVLPAGTNLTSEPLYQSGAIILQVGNLEDNS